MNIKDIAEFGSDIYEFFSPDEITEMERKAIFQGNIEHLKAKEESYQVAAKAQSRVLNTELKGDLKIQKLWRPILMLSFGLIIFISYGLFPVINAMLQVFSITSTTLSSDGDSLTTTIQLPILSIPAQMWDLLTIGIGGYIVGRSVEKSVDKYKNG